jgi:hypothetical protein
MMFPTISRVVFFPISLQSGPAWKSKWMPTKLSARFNRFGASAADAARAANNAEMMEQEKTQAAGRGNRVCIYVD